MLEKSQRQAAAPALISLTMDTRTPGQRRRIMQAVKSKDTNPEMIVRRCLYAMGYRYRIHRKDLPGRPDIVFSGRQKAIFVHGCFWHWHGCPKGQLPKSRLDYWRPKLEHNVRRDRANIEQLELIGWRVLVIWQCQTTDAVALAGQLRAFLDEQKIRRIVNITASWEWSFSMQEIRICCHGRRPSAMLMKALRSTGAQ